MAVWAAVKDLGRAVNELQNQIKLLEVSRQLELKLDRMLRDQEVDARLRKVQEEVAEVRALNEVMFNSMVQPDTCIHFVTKHASNARKQLLEGQSKPWTSTNWFTCCQIQNRWPLLASEAWWK